METKIPERKSFRDFFPLFLFVQYFLQQGEGG